MSVFIEAYPVFQNENREHCEQMYLEVDFIQKRFIDNKNGLKFTYQDKVIANLIDLE